MNKLQWAVVAFAAALIWLNSAFPPRHYGGQPDRPAGRAFILSDYFDKADIADLPPSPAFLDAGVKTTSQITFRSAELDRNRRDFWNLTICALAVFFLAATGLANKKRSGASSGPGQSFEP